MPKSSDKKLSPKLPQAALRQTDADLRAAFEKILPPQKINVAEGEENPEDRLWSAIRYCLMNGGKRIRPFLALQFARLFAVAPQNALQVAMAIEALHCYSLVHDDLPAMDDDDMRRGQPSLHKKYDEATAILAGDALQSLAFGLLCESHKNPRLCLQLLRGFATAAGAQGMVGGQMTDMSMSADNRSATIATITRLQRLKTGCLFEFACESMAILGQVGEDARAASRGYAHDLGLAFQMTDDLLDEEMPHDTGKSQGKDKRQNKATWVNLIGADKTRRQAEILCNQAVDHLAMFDDKADLLRALAQSIPHRKS